MAVHGTPELLSAALFEQDDALLAAHRRAGRRPFAEQWVLPIAVVRNDETAEEALRRHASDEFGIQLAQETFVETVYLEDTEAGRRYVANIFRAELGGAPMRFRADGDYDDARWLSAPDLPNVWMPPALRTALIAILTGEPAEPEQPDAALPLAERAGDEPEAPPPDNREAWRRIARSYQAEHARFDPTRLRWSRGLYEDDLRVLGDVRGLQAIVLGCADGADVIALAAAGAIAIGVDFVPAQIAAAKRRAADAAADNASFVEGDITDLSRFDDASFDLALSIHALDFVEDAERVLGEASRVVRPGGVLAIAVLHPMNQVLTEEPPYTAVRPYWASYVDFDWDTGEGATRLRAYRRTVEDWVRVLTGAGFTIEAIREPRQDAIAEDEREGFDMARARLLPQVLIIKARKR